MFWMDPQTTQHRIMPVEKVRTNANPMRLQNFIKGWYLPKFLCGKSSTLVFPIAELLKRCDFQVETISEWIVLKPPHSVPMLRRGFHILMQMFGRWLGRPRNWTLASGLGSCPAGTQHRMDFELSLFLLRCDTRKTPWTRKTRWTPGIQRCFCSYGSYERLEGESWLGWYQCTSHPLASS